MIKKNSINYYDIVFILLIFSYILLGILLVINIPYTFPFGGPDEVMHISMAKYIAKHLSWPNWDSTELTRNAYGVSYSTGSAIVYWLHGLSYKIFGHHRIGSFILLLFYLLLASIFYRKNRLAGFFLLASLFPQTLFIFSYVNSDTGTIITALLLGMSIGLYLIDEDNERNFLLMMFFAGFAVTARQHMWAIAFFALIAVLIYKYKTILKYNKKFLIIGLIVALIPASWWFITSYLANDGDILGAFTNIKSILKFSKEGLPSLGRDWSHFSINTFFQATLISIYGNWGWVSLPLSDYEYIFIAMFVAFITVVLYKTLNSKIFFFLIFLIVLNFIFMIVYSIFYDYQPQGRYLFPSIYVNVGIIAITLLLKKIESKKLLFLLSIFAILNILFSTKLLINSYLYLDKPTPIKYENIQYYKNVAMHIDGLKIIDKKLFARGWAFNKANGQPFNNLKLVLQKDNKFYEIDLNPQERKDVAKAFRSKNLLNAGFNVKMIDITKLEKGKYKCFLSVNINNKTMLIDCKKSLKI